MEGPPGMEGDRMLSVSRLLAALYSVGVPVIETWRRWGSIGDDLPALLDDYLIGAALLAGVWATRRGHHRAVLAAAWGLLLGIAYGSIVGQWRLTAADGQDPSQLSAALILWVKVTGSVIAAIGLACSLGLGRRRPSQ